MKTARDQTREHIRCVGKKISVIHRHLIDRMRDHDASKLVEPEVSIFDIYTKKLKGTTYGSEDYKRYLSEMKPALDHHYANNRHHPEHFENGISGMNLIDVVEMFCDWLAATERHEDGDIYKSITFNQKRFSYSDDLAQIFRNTADIFKLKEAGE